MTEHTAYKQCVRCIMDTSDTEITFDENGVCNHCHNYDVAEKIHVLKGEAGLKKVQEITEYIKENSKGNKYDCIIGISGGVDSSYLAYYAKVKMGLNPLAVHFDNGWNSEIAVKNIHHIVQKLGIDLYTYVINWEEFRDLQLAYIKASVIDIEVPTDQLIFGSLYKIARKKKIKFILSGNNVETEEVLPKSWIYPQKFDSRNLKAIHKAYGSVKLKDFPTMGKWRQLFNRKFFSLEQFRILNYIEYNKKEALEVIKKELDWQDYGGKHFESIFTRFYQGYILPKKFNVDKRRAHLSNLILSGQMSREDALKEMEQVHYSDELIAEDKVFFLKKLGLSEEEFDKIMNEPERKHHDFPYEISVYKQYPLLSIFKPIGRLISKR